MTQHSENVISGSNYDDNGCLSAAVQSELGRHA